jgi:hypothetical protein
VEKAPFPLQERQPACSLRSATVYKIEKALCFAAPGATRIGRNAADRAGEHVAVLEINSPDRDGAPVLARPSWMVFLHPWMVGCNCRGMPWLGPACPDLA